MSTEKDKKDNYYTDPKEFHDKLTTWVKLYRYNVENGLEKPRVTDYIGQQVYLICTNLAKHSSFRGYTWKDEMISEAMIRNIKYIHNYNYEKYDNPYSYVNRIARQAFVFIIERENEKLRRDKEFIQAQTALPLFQYDASADYSDQRIVDQVISDKVNQFFDNGCYQTKTINMDNE